MLVDFACNVVPFCWRHLFPVNFIGFLYYLTNFIVHLETGKEVTKHFDWSSVMGWVYIVVSWVVYNLFFICVKFISDYKLNRNGYSTFVNSIRDEFHIRKTTDVEGLARSKDAFGLYNHYKPGRFHSVDADANINPVNPYKEGYASGYLKEGLDKSGRSASYAPD